MPTAASPPSTIGTAAERARISAAAIFSRNAVRRGSRPSACSSTATTVGTAATMARMRSGHVAGSSDAASAPVRVSQTGQPEVAATRAATSPGSVASTTSSNRPPGRSPGRRRARRPSTSNTRRGSRGAASCAAAVPASQQTASSVAPIRRAAMPRRPEVRAGDRTPRPPALPADACGSQTAGSSGRTRGAPAGGRAAARDRSPMDAQ